MGICLPFTYQPMEGNSMFYPRFFLLIRRRICVQLAGLDPMIGTVFGALLLSMAILAMLGGVR